ncbi:MFS transporter [Saccharopolyspora flava]|uniref:Predicted arabinose efflux permease, MFS family n=1 Tax=Saccharopolyspora flava TaxID=95161 RepID=A0A1I6RN92_9PSEU|nr:MFS transporter [Saccharopolyspora flava]SFS66162.1 Predicted arabinose efflux permease, MFS family [Saccharopolyspora flava]
MRGRTYPVLCLGQFAATAGLTIVVPLLPFYLAGIGTPRGEIPWWTAVSVAAPAVVQLVSGPLWGWVGDRFGHKAMVVRAHAGLGLAIALMAVADTPEEFLGCRLLQGACGGVVSATASYASAAASTDRRGRALGMLFAATAAGSLLGPLVGGLLATRLGFAPLFAAVAGMLAISSALAAVSLAEAHAHARERHSPRAIAALLLRRRETRWMLLAGFAAQAAIYALVVVFAPQVERISGSVAAATTWVGVLQAVTWAASCVGSPWWGRRNDRGSAQLGFAVAAACCAVAVALQGVVPVELLLPLRVAQGFCFAALLQSVLHVSSRHAPERGSGTAFGFSTGVLDLGQVFGPLAGAALAVLLPPSVVFALIGAMLGTAALLAVAGRAKPEVSAGTSPHDPVGTHEKVLR